MAPPISISLVFFLLCLVSKSHSLEFTFNGFNQSDLRLAGDSAMKDRAVRLTSTTKNIFGRAFYPSPVQFFTNTSSARNISSFSTHFVFLIAPSGSSRGGHGIAFTVAPSMEFPGAKAGHYLGILNESNEENKSNRLFMVEFDTVNGYKEASDSEGNQVGVNVNNFLSIESEPAAYYRDGTDRKRDFRLESGNPIQAWIDFDGLSGVLNVTVAPDSEPKPSRPLISRPLSLNQLFLENMYVGFSAATGEKTSSHYILAWSFNSNGIAPELDLSTLPIPPKVKKSPSSRLRIHALIGALSAVVLLLLVALFFVVMYRRRLVFESLEDWELDCPHRFSYKDLYLATKGFRNSELLGKGGFGAVYKGVLPSTGAEVAVKKIGSNNSRQGMREFAAEIESLGRLRHKNLVNLQGWCKRENDLLLVYDYIPNGSLDSLLFKPRSGLILTWEQRYNILKGIAAGLLYLHEEWTQVVIHRDIKSSNVLIDGDMNGRLGDFGLARLYDHQENSHTTHVVGTIGYIAPELAQTGKASTSSDVFAYGVLLLEVASGRGSVVSDPNKGRIMLVEWIFELAQAGRILDAVDLKLGSGYDVKEMEMVLGLGLFCCHPIADARPTMRQIARYLNGDDLLPGIDKLGSDVYLNAQAKMSRFMGVFLGESNTTSLHGSSSAVEMSSSSIQGGR
ncbi:Lectin-domain containing receptor kinase [Actinidia chinensis var. chinensis]|uniref:non-specific serine/threonine protein kinase n=1 Tax=Actinidia chinensis var. chinensis TaxID=1590841 RepID=A0A2R6RXH8_ACTCC|nr:Lectin-domain containing receptor kinase [Actinidia chinensis var. chinensis]